MEQNIKITNLPADTDFIKKIKSNDLLKFGIEGECRHKNITVREIQGPKNVFGFWSRLGQNLNLINKSEYREEYIIPNTRAEYYFCPDCKRDYLLKYPTYEERMVDICENTSESDYGAFHAVSSNGSIKNRPIHEEELDTWESTNSESESIDLNEVKVSYPLSKKIIDEVTESDSVSIDGANKDPEKIDWFENKDNGKQK